jgi:hypothetical protein
MFAGLVSLGELKYSFITLGGVFRQALEGTLLVAYQSANT